MRNDKKILKALLVFFLTFLLIGSSVQHISQISANEVDDLERREQEREEDFLSQLLLDIPSQTDNPSHIITFVDPSEGREGVELEIDDRGFQTITSPYTLPALSIGNHELRFRFMDKYGSSQIIEREIIIIPRPPIINSPTFEEEFLQISGTGLANSELILMLSSDRGILVEETTIDSDSSWEIQVDNEELREGIYTFSAFTRRYGYASNLAEPITFEVGSTNRITYDNGREIYFSFKEITWDNVWEILSQNIDLGLLIGGAFVVGFFISLLLFTLVKGSIENKNVRVFEEKIKNGEKKKELTLKERLSQQKEEKKQKKEQGKKSKKKEKPSKKKEKKEKKGKTEKILTKVDFLKDYKKFDPDDDQGKEKENIEVKVTSKE